MSTAAPVGIKVSSRARQVDVVLLEAEGAAFKIKLVDYPATENQRGYQSAFVHQSHCVSQVHSSVSLHLQPGALRELHALLSMAVDALPVDGEGGAA